MAAPDTSTSGRSPSLDDSYTLSAGRVYLTGYQALVRLLLIQKARDEAAGLNTAGFVSGYRGSPLGGLDQTLWKARPHLQSRHIVFQPGVGFLELRALDGLRAKSGIEAQVGQQLDQICGAAPSGASDHDVASGAHAVSLSRLRIPASAFL